MPETHQPGIERSIGFLTVSSIASHFDADARMRSDTRRAGAIGWVGQRVFNALTKTPGVFARPVPFDRSELSTTIGFTDRTVARAMRRLVDQGLATISGSRRAPMMQLYLPEHVIAAHQRYVTRPGKDLREPISRDELDEALAWLDG